MLIFFLSNIKVISLAEVSKVKLKNCNQNSLGQTLTRSKIFQPEVHKTSFAIYCASSVIKIFCEICRFSSKSVLR